MEHGRLFLLKDLIELVKVFDCSWDYFTHDQARSRAYRWGEDGILGITDRECRLCFAVALWNGKDPILKERLYGLTGSQVKKFIVILQARENFELRSCGNLSLDQLFFVVLTG